MDSKPPAPDPSLASPAASGMAGPLAHMFSRVFTRHTMNMAVLMLVAILFAPSLGVHGDLIRDPDIWFHLANARILCTTHHFIRTEPYAFTVAGQEWIDWEWLSELPYWISYQVFKLQGIYLVAWLALCANILFVYWRGYWMSRNAGAAFWAAGIAFALMTMNSGPRTIAFAYLAMSTELAILEAAERGKKQLLWLLPPLFCLWINLHGSWLIGLVLLSLYILCGLFQVKVGVFEQDAFTAPERTRLLTVLGASVAALIVNPYGWRLVRNPFDTALNLKLTVVNGVEWQPLNLGWFVGKWVLLAIGLMVVANCLHGRKWKVFELAFVFFAWYMAFSHMRFTYLAAVVTIPMLAADMARSFFSEPDTKTIPVMNALMAAVAVCLMIFIFPKESRLEKEMSEGFPLNSIAAIQPSWRTFNTEHVGGMMDFQSKSPFIDTRFDIFEHRGILKDFLDIRNLNNSLQLLDKYGIDHALLKKDMALSSLLEHAPGWRVEEQEGAGDDAYELFANSTPHRER
jgi:hypothetical protein